MPIWRDSKTSGVLAEAIAALGQCLTRSGTAEPDLPERKWRLWQVETSLACNLDCVMCPWKTVRQDLGHRGNMAPAVWEALAPFLGEVASVDFSGGGEPLLQPRLFDWIKQARTHGCDTGFLTNGLLLTQDEVKRILDLEMTWIGISVDGADAPTYEAIRKKSSFDTVCRNIRYLTRQSPRPLVMINFVIMPSNCGQLEQMVDLARDLGVDQINFKQCDVIRGNHGKGMGLFSPGPGRDVAALEKKLTRARKKARKLRIRTTAFAFVPEEQPVCPQDPRSSLFVGYDGRISPCINLAMGGPSLFLGKAVFIPQVSFGGLPGSSLPDIWANDSCQRFRDRFDQRVRAHDTSLACADIGRDLIKLKTALSDAIKAMPAPCDGCRICHYLYGI